MSVERYSRCKISASESRACTQKAKVGLEWKWHCRLDFFIPFSLLPSSFNSLIVPVFSFFCWALYLEGNVFGKDFSRRRSRVNTDRFPKWAPKAQASKGGSGGGSPQEIFWILTPLSPLSWPISVKRWKPVWIHGCFSLRSADAFPVVASLPPKTIFRRERSDDRKCVCASQATAV